MTNPFDELNVQLPGRLITVEILLTLLLREKAQKAKLLAEADAMLNTYEQAILQDQPGQSSDYALKMFAVARESLDMIRRNASGR